MIGSLVQVTAFLAVTGLFLYMFAKVVYHRFLYLKLGQPVELEKQLKERLTAFLVQTFGHTKLLKDRRSGVMHLAVFYGFIILQFGALDIILKGLIGRGLPIPGYAAFGLMQEVTVLAVLLAIGYAAYRRYVENLKRLNKGWKPGIVVFFSSSSSCFRLCSRWDSNGCAKGCRPPAMLRSPL